jgi:hypothetical protein
MVGDSADETEAADNVPLLSFEQRRARLGLRPLASDERSALEWAISQQTPAAARLEEMLKLGAELGADILSSEEVDAWTRALARMDAIAYCVRLVEAQILVGNVGTGMMLPDSELEVDLP